MNEVIQTVEQTSIVNPYNTGENQPCSDGDWAYGTKRDCGPNCIILECSELDSDTCPKIGNNVKAEWKLNDVGESDSPLVSCIYNPSTFTYNDVIEYVDKFGKDEQYNNVVMPQFCLNSNIKSKNCENNPRTGEPWESCVYMLDKGSDNLCLDWRSDNIELADTAQNNYCLKNPSDPACDCYNREKDPVFDLVSEGNPYNPGCWYFPCTYPESYLVPSTLINDDPPCPEESIVCNEINSIIANSTSNLPSSVIQKSVTCEVTASPKPVSSSSTFSGGGFFIFFIIFIVILVIIIVIIYFVYSKRKTKNIEYVHYKNI